MPREAVGGVRKLLQKLFGAHPYEEKELFGLFDYRFKNPELLEQALTHRSAARQPGKSAANYAANERLEFLGDAVLGLVASRFLYDHFPDKDEGELSKLKAALVNKMTLSRIAEEIGLGKFVKLSPEEERMGGRSRRSIIADAYEALLGAVYLDGGILAATEMIETHLLSRLGELASDRAHFNYKGELLEYLQGRQMGTPRYIVETEEGPDHHKKFTMICMVLGTKLAVGVGASKKEAEQKAARLALLALHRKEDQLPRPAEN